MVVTYPEFHYYKFTTSSKGQGQLLLPPACSQRQLKLLAQGRNVQQTSGGLAQRGRYSQERKFTLPGEALPLRDREEIRMKE